MSSDIASSPRPRLRLTDDVALRHAVEEFYYAYAEVVDSGNVKSWPDFFTDDAVYRVIARDNFEANLPLSLMSCEGRGMLIDRAFAIMNTEMFAPRYTLHQITNIRIMEKAGEYLNARANYTIYETLCDEPSRLLQCGRYLDKFALNEDGLKLKERRCVYDTLLVPTCLVFPP